CVRDVQRRRHDVRGCWCRFWVRYRHGITEVRWVCTNRGHTATHVSADVRDVQRRRHDVRGCRCPFWVRYRHDNTERTGHDVRGRRCWFWVRYRHDNTERRRRAVRGCRSWVRYWHDNTDVRCICCSCDRGETATHVSGDMRDVQRRHVVRGCWCRFWVRYRHNNRCRLWVQMPVGGADAGCGCRCRLGVQMPVVGADAGWGCRCRLWVQMPVGGADAGCGCWCRLWVRYRLLRRLKSRYRHDNTEVERIHLPLLLTNPLPSFPPLPSFTLFPRSGGGASAQDLPKARDRV
ncbi:unnamed protein product, partial [Closterium sp. NIES-53]